MIEHQEDVGLNLNGVDTRVNIMRIGRIAMYYMTMDRKQSACIIVQLPNGACPGGSVKEFKRHLICPGKKAAEIVELPLGAI
jgi:hypothetical protein